jgi:hypothetical protein
MGTKTDKTDFQAFPNKVSGAMSDAMTKSASHFQSIAMDNVDYAKRAYEDATAAFSQLAKVSSFDRAAEIQRDYVKSAYEGFVQHVSQLGEKQAAFVQEVAGSQPWSPNA